MAITWWLTKRRVRPVAVKHRQRANAEAAGWTELIPANADLVFFDWLRDGKSIYGELEGVEASMGDFHSGTMFKGSIRLDEDQQADLDEQMAAGLAPIFYVVRRARQTPEGGH